MNGKIEPNVLRAIRTIYEEEGAAKPFFEWAAARINDAAETSIDRIIQVTGAVRWEANALAKSLSDAGCGEYIVGRRGGKTRVRWFFSLRSLGKAAVGEEDKIDKVDPELAEDASDLPSDVGAGKSQSLLTIAEAKRMLAESLGVSEGAIEIIVRG